MPSLRHLNRQAITTTVSQQQLTTQVLPLEQTLDVRPVAQRRPALKAWINALRSESLLVNPHGGESTQLAQWFYPLKANLRASSRASATSASSSSMVISKQVRSMGMNKHELKLICLRSAIFFCLSSNKIGSQNNILKAPFYHQGQIWIIRRSTSSEITSVGIFLATQGLPAESLHH